MIEIEKENLTVKETFEILKKLGLTKSEQVVRRWIRGKVQGKELKSTPPPPGAFKIGHRINKQDLEEFIKKHGPIQPQIVEKKVDRSEVEGLQNELSDLKRRVKELEANEKNNEALSGDKNKEKSIENDFYTLAKNAFQESVKNLERLEEDDFYDLSEKVYQETVLNFEDINEKEYQGAVRRAATMYIEKKFFEQQIKELKEENMLLKLAAGKIRVSKEDRMVLRGLGVSVGEILNSSTPRGLEESVQKVEITNIDGWDKIDISFKYKNELYKGTVKTGIRYVKSEEKPLNWRLFNVRKTKTNRNVSEKKVDSIIYDVLYKTFSQLYEQESNKKEHYQYLY